RGSTSSTKRSNSSPGTPWGSSQSRAMRSRKIDRKMKDSGDASSRNQSSHRAATVVTEPGVNTPLTSSGFSLPGYIGADSKLLDGEHRAEVLDAVPPEQLPRPLEPVHQGHDEDDFAPGLSDRLDGLHGRAALGEHVIHDDDPGALRESALD